MPLSRCLNLVIILCTSFSKILFDFCRSSNMKIVLIATPAPAPNKKRAHISVTTEVTFSGTEGSTGATRLDIALEDDVPAAPAVVRSFLVL